jgi:hypothetical protein
MLDKEWCYCGRPDCVGYAVAELNELHYETLLARQISSCAKELLPKVVDRDGMKTAAYPSA